MKTAPRNPWKARIILGTTVVASVASIAAFRTLFARPGEAALRLVPANAMMVVTADLSPGPGQLLAFKQIDESLEKHGSKNKLEASLIDIFETSAKGREALRPLIMRSGSFFVLPRGKDESLDNPVFVAMLSVTSGEDAQRALQKEGVAKYFRGAKYFKLKYGESLYAVYDDLLVCTRDPEAILAVKQVREGSPSILSNPDFRATRSRFAEDANVMAFISPKIGDLSGTKGLMADWGGMSLAIRDNGMEMKMEGKFDPSKHATFDALGKIKPLREDLMHILPSGAYGAVAISQIAKMEQAVESGFDGNEEVKKGFDEMESSLRKEAGMDFRKDILPAFMGNTVLAAYPSGKSETGLDLLFVVDDLHDADPANAMERFSAFMDDEASKNGGPGHFFVRKEEKGIRYAEMDPQLTEDMNRDLFGDGTTDGPFKKDPLGGPKTLAYAVIGKGIIAATSQDLLNRAIESYQNQMGSLSDDPGYSAILPAVREGNQETVAFNFARIAKGFRMALDEKKLKDDDKKMWDGVLGAFEGLETPMATHVKFTPEGRVSMTGTVPMDYAKLFDFIGGLLKGDAPKK